MTELGSAIRDFILSSTEELLEGKGCESNYEPKNQNNGVNFQDVTIQARTRYLKTLDITRKLIVKMHKIVNFFKS